MSWTGWSGDSWALWPGWGPGPPPSVGFPGAPGSCPPRHSMSEATGTASLLLWPSSLPTTWNQKGAPERVALNPTGCSCALGPRGWEGLEGAHSRDVSGWVCLWRLQEESSTCPRNAHVRLLHPGSLSAQARLRGGRQPPRARQEFCLSAKPSLRHEGPICPCG